MEAEPLSDIVKAVAPSIAVSSMQVGLASGMSLFPSFSPFPSQRMSLRGFWLGPNLIVGRHRRRCVRWCCGHAEDHYAYALCYRFRHSMFRNRDNVLGYAYQWRYSYAHLV